MDPDVGGEELLASRYRLGGLLGHGGMAGVFDAYDTRLARPVAVKVLRPEICAQPSMRARFEQEARSAAGLSHPNVVSVYDSGEDGDQAFLVMERLPGRSLADLVAKGPLDQRQVVGITADVLGALVAAHGIGMVHRDIKPGNILLTNDGRAKVADFGIAKSLEPAPDGSRNDFTMAGLVIGTPAYLAPERLSGAAATPQSDLFAVGVVMFEALTGRKPAEGADLAAVAQARRTPPPDIAALRPDVAPWLAAVVRRAMAPRPEARYRSAREMLAELRSEGRGRRLPPAPMAVAPGAAAVAAGAPGAAAAGGAPAAAGGAPAVAAGAPGAAAAGGAPAAAGAGAGPPGVPPSAASGPGTTQLIPGGTGSGTQVFPAGGRPAAAGGVTPTRLERPAAYPQAVPPTRLDHLGAAGPPGYYDPQAGPPARPPRHNGAWIAAAMVAALLIAAVVVGIILVAGHKGHSAGSTTTSSSTTSPSTSTTATTTATTTGDAVAQQLHQLADQLEAAGGAGPDSAATLLRGVAAKAPGSGRTRAANRAVTQVQHLYDEGSISSAQYGQAIGALESAGANAPATTTTTTTSTTVPRTTTTTVPRTTTTTVPRTTTTTSTTPSTTTPSQGQGGQGQGGQGQGGQGQGQGVQGQAVQGQAVQRQGGDGVQGGGR